jgi:type II secretory pathway pseudopilin PulG
MKLQHVVAAAVCLLVIVGLVAGFTVVGPPSHARDVALDRKRADDLQDLAGRLRTRYRDTGELPASLPADWVRGRDPATNRPYAYRRIDRSHFVLCATFSAPSENDGIGTSLWSHGAGQKCYTLDQSSEPLR